MAILTIIAEFTASHGSVERRSDSFGVEVKYEGPVVDGFISGLSYTAIKGQLETVLQELTGTWLNEIIGRATKERLAEYLLYRLHRTNPISVRIVQMAQIVEIFSIEVDFTDYEFSLVLARAEGLMFQCKFKDSLELLTNLSQEYANRNEVRHIRGRCWKYEGEYERAKDEFLKILKDDPDNGEAHRNVGNVYYELGQHELMMTHFDRAVEILPTSARALNNRGFALQVLKQFEEAVADHSQAIALDPNYAEAYSDRAEAYDRLGQASQAEADRGRARCLRESGMDTYKHREITS